MTGMRSSLALAATLLLASMISAPAGAKDRYAPVFVKLTAVGGSGQSGRAIMRNIGPLVVISGDVAHESPTALEPAHLRKGPCGSNAPTLAELGMVANGTLGTHTWTGTIAQLRAMHASIAVSKSEKALGVLVSCGNI